MEKTVKWRAFSRDGHPTKTGRYLLAHCGMVKTCNYFNGKGNTKEGWDGRYKWASHWCPESEVTPDRDDAPQYFRKECKEAWNERVDYNNWNFSRME